MPFPISACFDGNMSGVFSLFRRYFPERVAGNTESEGQYLGFRIFCVKKANMKTKASIMLSFLFMDFTGGLGILFW